MGCVHPNIPSVHHNLAGQVKTGLLKIQIKKAEFKCLKIPQGQNSNFTLKIWVTNQVYEFPLADFIAPPYGHEMLFIINSHHLHFGRSLNVQISHSLHPDPDTTAFGIADLDEILEAGEQAGNHEIFLNYMNNPGCVLEYYAHFEEFPSQKFKANINYPKWLQGSKLNKKLKAKFVIGEEFFEFELTHPDKAIFKDHYQSPSFFIPTFLSTANLEIFEEYNRKRSSLGSSVINLHKILSSNRQIIRIEENISNNEKKIGTINIKLTRMSDIALPFMQKINEDEIVTSIRVIEPQKTKETEQASDTPTQKKIAAKLPAIELTVRTVKKIYGPEVTKQNKKRPSILINQPSELDLNPDTAPTARKIHRS